MRFTHWIITITTVLALCGCSATESSQGALNAPDSMIITTATQPTERAEMPTEEVVLPPLELPVATEPAAPNIPNEKPDITEPTTSDVPEEPSGMAPTVPEVPIPDPPKEVHTHSYTITATPPTCTQQGVTHYTCTCGYSYNEVSSALEHEWGHWHVIKEATTEEDGEEGMYCKRCNTKISNPLEKLPILATNEDWEEVADLLIQYINGIRATEGVAPAIKMGDGCAEYAKLRSEQMAAKGEAEHSVSDGRAAATQLQYGYYVDPNLYGIPGEPYYFVNGQEAVAKDLALTIDGSAQRLANGFHHSPPHWSYVGTYSYISVGLTLRGGFWYCCIIMAEVDLDENPNGF